MMIIYSINIILRTSNYCTWYTRNTGRIRNLIELYHYKYNL